MSTHVISSIPVCNVRNSPHKSSNIELLDYYYVLIKEQNVSFKMVHKTYVYIKLHILICCIKTHLYMGEIFQDFEADFP